MFIWPFLISCFGGVNVKIAKLKHVRNIYQTYSTYRYYTLKISAEWLKSQQIKIPPPVRPELVETTSSLVMIARSLAFQPEQKCMGRAKIHLWNYWPTARAPCSWSYEKPQWEYHPLSPRGDMYTHIGIRYMTKLCSFEFHVHSWNTAATKGSSLVWVVYWPGLRSPRTSLGPRCWLFTRGTCTYLQPGDLCEQRPCSTHHLRITGRWVTPRCLYGFVVFSHPCILILWCVYQGRPVRIQWVGVGGVGLCDPYPISCHPGTELVVRYCFSPHTHCVLTDRCAGVWWHSLGATCQPGALL